MINNGKDNLKDAIKSVQITVDETPKVALKPLVNLPMNTKNVTEKILNIPKNK